MKLNWNIWLYGLFNGVIGGAATAGVSWFGMDVAKAAGFNIPSPNWQSLGVVLISGALTNAFFYLKQSPLPAIETITTTVTTQKTVETTETPTKHEN